MKKSYLVILLALALGVGTVLGAYITRFVWQTTMTMRLTGIHTFNVELQYPNGTAITDYDWGDFSYGQMKTLYCNLVFLGNGTYVAYWNTTDLSSDWYIQIWKGPADLWDENQLTVAHSAGELLNLEIQLTAPLGYGQLDEPLSFTLNFATAEWTP